jgi:hypothetical protein
MRHLQDRAISVAVFAERDGLRLSSLTSDDDMVEDVYSAVLLDSCFILIGSIVLGKDAIN